MKESSPIFDDGQPWGEETEDGIMYNKVTLFTINIRVILILLTKCVTIKSNMFFCRACLLLPEKLLKLIFLNSSQWIYSWSHIVNY